MKNIFEKAEPAKPLAGMSVGRQKGFANDISLYGKWHIISVRPISDLPYSIVTFYDKGYILPVIMRIVIFALVFSIISTLVSIALLVLLSKVAFRRPLLYSPMDFLSWLPPRKTQATFYTHMLIYLATCFLLLLVSAMLRKAFDITDFTIFSMVLLTPFNVVYACSSHYPMKPAFLVVQLLFSLWMWLYVFFSGKPESFFYIAKACPYLTRWKNYFNYRRKYNLMATFLVVMLSVIPSGLFEWGR